MSTFGALRHRLQEIATSATTAAEALDGCACDFLPPELHRFLVRLDALQANLEAVAGPPLRWH
jgi:hypothetical protein